MLPPHELLGAYLVDRLGHRRLALFGAMREQLFEPIVIGLVDQMSAYCDQIPGARIRVRGVNVKQGAERAYLMASLTDRGRRLRLRDATERWDIDLKHDRADELTGRINAGRWRFVERHLSSFLEPLTDKLCGALATYYEERPGAVVQAGLVRIIEGENATWLVAEIDDRSELTTTETAKRYEVQ